MTFFLEGWGSGKVVCFVVGERKCCAFLHSCDSLWGEAETNGTRNNRFSNSVIKSAAVSVLFGKLK